MRQVIGLVSVLAMAAGCTATTGGGIGGGGGGGGTTGSASCSGKNTCVGEVNSVSYDAVNDTLTLNNLVGVAGNNVYSRAPTLDRNGFRAYQNNSGFNSYVAFYNESASGKTYAGAVGTGDYANYGYGGAFYGAKGAVSLPTSGVAVYTGNYAAIRVYEANTLGQNYGFADGVAQVSVDFNDFDVGGGIDSVIFGRNAYDSNGNALGALPALSGTTTTVTGGNSKFTTAVTEINPGGSAGTGTLEGIFGGANGDEIAGVVILTGQDALSTTNVMERGVFLLTQTSFVPG